MPSSSEAERAVVAVWKSESARLIATLTRLVRDLGLAEELAQDALVAALVEWPSSGIPANPRGWLVTIAKNRALNLLRHRRVIEQKGDAALREHPNHVPLEAVEGALEAGMDEDVADDMLRLVFIACHPVLSNEARVALTLRVLGGLSTPEIARAFLATEEAISQRLLRAKRAIAEAKVPFEVPRGPELAARLGSVLEVVYLIFNEGYSASAGEDVMRPELVAEALRLGRMLCELAPDEPEAHGLLALMELHASRAGARTDASGEPILLMEQDRARWDRAGIARGLDALARAESRTRIAGLYQLQAEIAACHARAQTPGETDWARIVGLYGELVDRHPSPIVELNRAIAISRARGPREGLILLDALTTRPALARYHLLPSARADLLEQLGAHAAARIEFERAASLTENAVQRRRLLERAAVCARAARS